MRILLPRFDTHGDLILLAGFLDALAERFPDADITLLVRSGYDQLAPLFPARLQWHTVRVRPYQPVSPRDGQLTRLQHYFDAHKYDLLIGTCFTQTWVDSVVAFFAAPEARRISLCCATGPLEVPAALWSFLGERPRTDCALWEQAVVADEDSDECSKYQILWDALPARGEKMDVSQPASTRPHTNLPPPQLLIPPALDAQAREILTKLDLVGAHYVCCCPAGTVNTPIKAWPGERFAAVVARLERSHGLPTLLIGHESERSLIESVRARAFAHGARPRVWLGRDGQLPLLAALIRRARLYVGNDTGPMHIAAALNVPTVSIFGGGHWPRFVPRANTVALVRELLCFKCDWNCLFADALCIKLVRTEDVHRAVDLVLADTRRTPASDGDGTAQLARPSRIIRLDTPLDIEPMDVWLRKVGTQAAAAGPSFGASLVEALARRLRSLRDA